MTTTATITPFRIDVPQARLDDLAARLRGALYPDELPVSAMPTASRPTGCAAWPSTGSRSSTGAHWNPS